MYAPIPLESRMSDEIRAYPQLGHLGFSLPTFLGWIPKLLLVTVLIAMLVGCSDDSGDVAEQPANNEVPVDTPVVSTSAVDTPVVSTPTSDTSKSASDAQMQEDVELTGQGSVDTDREALEAFYDSTNGEEWDDSGIWGSPNPLADWPGVTVGEDGRVIELDLWAKGLTGEIPPELGDLSNLEVLELSENGLTGEIPSELGDLSYLVHLSLWGNQLMGEIPPELGNLSNLDVLDLSDNQLTGEIPLELGDLSYLVHLSLWGNQLTGEIPSELGKLYDLEYLDLSNNQLSGEIPPELGNLSNLEDLDLWGNQLTGEVPPELGNLSNLEELDLDDNQLMGCIPDGLRGVVSSSLPFCDSSGGVTGQQPTSAEVPADTSESAQLQEYAEALEEALSVADQRLEDAFEDIIFDSLFTSGDADRINSLMIDESWTEEDTEFASKYAQNVLYIFTGGIEEYLEALQDWVDEVSGLRPPGHLSDLHNTWTAHFEATFQAFQEQVESIESIDTDIENQEDLTDFLAVINSLEVDSVISADLVEKYEAACLALEVELEAELGRDVSFCY